MERLLGIGLILLGCAGALLGWMEEERGKQEMMQECIRFFAHWQYALKSGQVRLYDFFEQYESGQESLADCLAEVTGLLQKNCYATGQEVWKQVLIKHKKQLLLRGESFRILLESADAFFSDSSMEGLRCIGVCRERMETCLAFSREEFFRKKRVYMPLGMLGGVVLIILLV